MIQDVEDLRPELNVERLRNAMYRIVLGGGEIQVYEFGPGDGIASRIAHEIRAINLPNWRRNHRLTMRWIEWECGALGCECRRSRYRRKREAARVDVDWVGTADEIVVDGITTGSEVGNAELVGTAISHPHWVSTNDNGTWDPRIDFEDAAYLPSPYHSLHQSVG